jgi:hypothetical protein
MGLMRFVLPFFDLNTLVLFAILLYFLCTGGGSRQGTDLYRKEPRSIQPRNHSNNNQKTKIQHIMNLTMNLSNEF